MLNGHLPKAVLISSASIVTIAFVAIASQTVDWSQMGRYLNQTITSEETGHTEPDRKSVV